MSIRTKKWILGIAIAAVTLFIWSMSLQSAAVSFQQSDAIAAPMTEHATAPGKWLSDVPPPGSWLSVFSILVRKSAHFIEFAVLGLLWGGFSRLQRLRVPWLYGLAVAIVDEAIQHFIPGRSPSAVDVALDWAGYLFGFLLIVLIAALIRRKSKK